MANAWEKRLYRGEPYVSGEQPKIAGLIKLNTNENPYPPSPAVAAALETLAKNNGEKFRLYPPADGGELRCALAKYHGLDPENIFVGNGSDEVLAFAFRACFSCDTVRFANITYSFYPVWCEFFGIPFETIPLTDNLHIDSALYKEPCGGIVICNPNAPTGIMESETEIRGIIEAQQDCAIIIDEAYADFAEWSAVPLTCEYPNLLVTRSFSKSRSLAGLRVGYAVGDARLIRAISAAKDSFNSYPLGFDAIYAGAAALGDEEYYSEMIARVKKTREDSASQLRELGFDVPSSASNFLYCGCGSRERAGALFAALRADGILVRYFDKPGTDDRLRISVGTDQDMAALVTSVRTFTEAERG